MSTYQATMPPDDTTCGMRSCSARATVRTVIPPSRFEADGVDHSQDPSTFDTCVCHWPIMRAAVLGNGHEITDTTGDIEALKADSGADGELPERCATGECAVIWGGGRPDDVPRGSPWLTVVLLLVIVGAVAAIMLADR